MPKIQGKQIADKTITQSNLNLLIPLQTDITSGATVGYVNNLTIPALSIEASIRSESDVYLSTAIVTESNIRSLADDSLRSLISSGSSTENIINISLSTAIVNEITKRSLADVSLSTSILTHTHSKLVNSGGTTVIYVDNQGKVHIDGDIIQSGATWETHAEKIFTSGNTITLREGATLAMGINEYAGFIAKKYDGQNDGLLIFDSGGTARVGDINSTQPLATREETPTDTYIAVWDAVNMRFKTVNPLTLPIASDISSELSTEITIRSLADSSLSTAISSEKSIRSLADSSLSTAISSEISNRKKISGSGLTYNELTNKLNVNIDDYTIKIINNELRSSELWIDFNSTTTILNGEVGVTNLILSKEPIGYVSAYINGVEYLVSPTFSSQNGIPFYFTSLPKNGSYLYYDSNKSGFGLENGIDLIMIKYNYINTI